jgi:uroporphyrinogen-III synthase
MARVNILCTKKLEPLLAGKAAVQGIRMVMKPFIQINRAETPETIALLRQIPDDAVWAFTSHNAVESLHYLIRKHGLTLPAPQGAYTMEGQTAEKCKQLFPGINIVGMANNARSLALHIAKQDEKQVVFFCGNLRRQELPEILKNENITLQEIQVYETVSTPVKVTENFDGIMFFSPSGINSFLEQNNLPSHAVCFAIGETTANELRKITKGQIRTAPQPTQESIVNLVIAYYSKT